MSAATYPYPSWLAEVMTASPETLGLVMLEADRYARRLDRATQLAAVRDALERLLQTKWTPEGIQLRRHLTFATARK